MKKTKRQIANRILKPFERKLNITPFDGDDWKLRIEKNKLKVIRRVKRAVIRRLEREIAKDKGVKVKYSIK